MSRTLRALLGLLAIVAVGGAALFVWYANSADVVGFSDTKGSPYRYNCDDPAHVNDGGCAYNACRALIYARDAVPPTYELRITHSSGSEKAQLVEGYIRSRDFDGTLPRKAVACAYANGRVSSLLIDGRQLVGSEASTNNVFHSDGSRAARENRR